MALKQFLLGLGSNLGDSLSALQRAVQLIADHKQLKLLKVSPVYRSNAQLKPGAPAEWNLPFLNLAILVETNLTPLELLQVTQRLEARLGRPKKHLEWSPRTIDIDILMAKFVKSSYIKVHHPRLKVPHPSFLERPFALLPAAYVAPDWIAPGANLTLSSYAKQQWPDSRFVPFNTTCTTLSAHAPYLMGIINVTAESFSDGILDTAKALDAAKTLYQDGAAIIDVGAEATNPNAPSLNAHVEWQRLEPFLAGWTKIFPDRLARPKLSIDTYHVETLVKLLNYPFVDYFNLVLDTLSEHGAVWQRLSQNSKAKFIFTHNLALPNRSRCLDLALDPTTQVLNWAKALLKRAKALKIPRSRIIIDPGLGFSKVSTQDWQLLRHLDRLSTLKVPLLVGHSRKSFLGDLAPLTERDALTAQLSAYLAKEPSVEIIRVHNVKASRQALQLSDLLTT